MREIKFRVWDFQRNKWAIEYEARESMGFEFGIKDYFANTFEGERLRRWDFQQFIGLTDKKGKEIYEGDIVCLDDLKTHRWLIEYSACSFVGEPLKTNDFSQMITLRNNNYLQFEIIGNIHENPELVK